MILTHYTRTLDGVAGILENGFAWAPLPRNLIQDLVPSHDWSATEPQQYGLISFTEQPVPALRRHLETFGRYGIQVAPDWAQRQSATRVTYLERRGPLFDALKGLFAIGYANVKKGIRYPEDGLWNMACVYKSAAAALASPFWAHLLTVYEYLEPAENSYQCEWRVVHPTGVGNLSRDTSDRIRNVSPPTGWGKYLHVLPVRPADIHGFVCPVADREHFIARLPSGYRNKTIATYDG